MRNHINATSERRTFQIIERNYINTASVSSNVLLDYFLLRKPCYTGCIGMVSPLCVYTDILLTFMRLLLTVIALLQCIHWYELSPVILVLESSRQESAPHF